MLTDNEINALSSYFDVYVNKLQETVDVETAKEVKNVLSYVTKKKDVRNIAENVLLSPTQKQQMIQNILLNDSSYNLLVANSVAVQKSLTVKAFNDVFKSMINDTPKIIKEAGDLAFKNNKGLWAKGNISIKLPKEYQPILKRNVDKTTEKVYNILSGNIGVGSNKQFVPYQNIGQVRLDKTLNTFLQGKTTYTNALEEIAKQVSDDNLKVSSQNYTYDLQACLRRELLTASNKVNADITEANF